LIFRAQKGAGPNIQKIRAFSTLFDIVLLSEPFDAAGGIDQFLLTRKEGMTGGTNFHLDVFDRGSGFDNVPAGAADLCHLVFGMYLLFHLRFSSKNYRPTPAPYLRPV
jgi:hypothetical protein